jgi:uncharacterized protein HemX
MNSTFNDKQADRKAGQSTRLVLRAVLACALVLGASGAAFAQQHGDRDRDYGGAQPERHAERFRLPQQMERDPRQAEAQMRAYDEQRRMQQYPQPYVQPQPQYQEQPRPRPSGRMTADERAEMRRQVNEAKDFYPQRR